MPSACAQCVPHSTAAAMPFGVPVSAIRLPDGAQLTGAQLTSAAVAIPWDQGSTGHPRQLQSLYSAAWSAPHRPERSQNGATKPPGGGSACDDKEAATSMLKLASDLDQFNEKLKTSHWHTRAAASAELCHENHCKGLGILFTEGAKESSMYRSAAAADAFQGFQYQLSALQGRHDALYPYEPARVGHG